MSEDSKCVVTAAVDRNKEAVLDLVRRMMDKKAAETLKSLGYEKKED